jgi:hypothetical protein
MTAEKIIILNSKTVSCSVCKRLIKRGKKHYCWYGEKHKVLGRCCSDTCAKKFSFFWNQYQKDSAEIRECVKCDGIGIISVACHICEGDPHEYYGIDDECNECQGKGWIEKECPVCGGQGIAEEASIELSDYER